MFESNKSIHTTNWDKGYMITLNYDITNYFLISLEAIHGLALPQSLIKSLTQGQVRLLLRTLDEALDLPGTSSLWLLRLRLTVLRLLGVGWLLLLQLLFLVSSTTSHTSSEGAAHHMTHCTAHSHST